MAVTLPLGLTCAPYPDGRITHTVVLDDPLEDPAGLEVPDRSPPLTDAILNVRNIRLV